MDSKNIKYKILPKPLIDNFDLFEGNTYISYGYKNRKSYEEKNKIVNILMDISN